LAPILISFSRRLVSDHGSTAFGIASVRMAADPVIARSPTTQRIAGSRHSLSASFTSS
jgi:hypothetical protein